jgi:MoxR-like ATPase
VRELTLGVRELTLGVRGAGAPGCVQLTLTSAGVTLGVWVRRVRWYTSALMHTGPSPAPAREQALERVAELAGRLERELGKAIVGQQRVIREILMAFLAGGHCLLRGVPGLAKTLLIKKLAEAVDLRFNRVQFTPDLMPSDIIGAEVIEEDRATGKRVIRFIHGPIFANIVLADEINRTPPKTQAALLEAMQERQVTVNGVRFDLDRPFFVLATQNPIEQEGTYPLPEAQLDRFMFNVVIGYPSVAEERQILSLTTGTAEARIEVVASGDDIERMHALVREVPAAENVVDFAARLVRATRPSGGDEAPPAFVREWVRWGAGPRAGQALLLGAKARALLEGRSVVALDDITAVALPVLRHRILLNFQAEADGIEPDTVVGRLLDDVRP